MSDLFSSTKLQHRQILLPNSPPLQLHAHCLIRLVSTVRWASVDKKAERGVEGTGQRGGLQSLHRQHTHACHWPKNKRPRPHHRAKASFHCLSSSEVLRPIKLKGLMVWAEVVG